MIEVDSFFDIITLKDKHVFRGDYTKIYFQCRIIKIVTHILC